MHPDEVDADPALVQRLLAGQFPRLADLPLAPVASYGTDHHIFRLGERLAVRLPRVGWAARQAEIEAAWLPRFAPRLPLAVPAPRALGRPAEGDPFVWSVVEWLPGSSAAERAFDDPERAAARASFVRALRGIDARGAHPRPAGARGAPLGELDAAVRAAIVRLDERIDGAAALRSWEASLAAPAWPGPDLWVHGDLLPGNLLVVDGRLAAVIDFGGLHAGDPACDLQPAWNVFAGPSRRRFRTELAVDEASWLRGRGWALAQALVALPYYWETNPGIARQARRALARVLADDAARR